MEARLALAVFGFSQAEYQQRLSPNGLDELGEPVSRDGWAMVVGESSDDIYIQQVATDPQTLLYADNGSFIDLPGVDGDFGQISDINALRSLSVTNAAVINDLGVVNDNYPVFDFTIATNSFTTRFVSQHDDWLFPGVPGGGVVLATLEYTQADGVLQRWNIVGNAENDFTITPRPGTVQRPFDVWPVAASYYEPTGLAAFVRSSVDVLWRVQELPATQRQLGAPRISPFTSVPRLVDLTYNYSDEQIFPNVERTTEAFVLPSAASPVVGGATQPSTFTLPGAAGIGFAGIVPGTLRGTLRLEGAEYPFLVESRSGNRLVFGGGRPLANGTPVGLEYVLRTPGSKLKSVQGSVDLTTGVISLTFASGEDITPVAGSPIFVDQAPGPVSIDATYAVYDAGDPNEQAGSLTFFAGLNITNEVAVDLLPHGASINVDSPLIMRSTLTDGDTSLRATNVNIDAQLLANDRLEIGGSIGPRVTMLRQAYAYPTLAAGRVTGLSIPPGLAGAGYSPLNPPVVTIGGPITSPLGATPVVRTVNARLGEVTVDRDSASPTFGQVIAVQILESGSGYGAAPAVNIPAPDGGGATATATATLDASGAVVGIVITSGGSGYQASPTNPVATIFRPQAEATAIVDASGRISGFVITNAGTGYTDVPPVAIAPPEVETAAVPGAVTVVGGSVTGVAVADGGYGYRTPPLVWIAPPPKASGGVQALATATLDDAGRVIGITIVDPGSGYETVDIDGNVSDLLPEVRILAPFPLPQAEVVGFNAGVGARVYDVRTGDDPFTPRDRGLVLVSPSGWLTRDLAQIGAADAVFVQAFQSDVIVEGVVWGNDQSYLMQSLPGASDLAPFLLTTTSQATGASVGQLRGGTVGITLANDAPTPAEGAVAFNDVQLSTDIVSLRIRAATSAGVTRSDPFPYEMQVVEENSIAIEAVAASSFPLTMQAGQNLLFNANLATAGDVSLAATSLLTVSAPISTTTGRIGISAANVTVENSVQVTKAAADDARNDVAIEATGGSMTINGLVAGVNNVLLRQVNRRGPEVFEYSSRASVAIPDNGTVTQSIAVRDAFTYENLDVAVDITHSFVSHLTLTLIAPDGTRVRLFDRTGGAGDNFSGTIFDSEAATAITAGVAPFTGRFRPVQSLAPLYNRDARGTWQLEVRDNATDDVGTLTNFTLLFTSQQPATGRISGAARVRADHLEFDAEGNVGDPELAPGTGTFFLRTNVNSLSGRAGGSFSIDEVNDLSITDLRAGGLVSVRANGVDPVAGPNVGKAALTASLADVPAIDLNAPAGSIDVVNNAPTTIIVGNAEALRTGRAISMRAAGNVSIRSTGGATRGEIFALDAPLAGSGARTVRYRYAPSALPAGAIYVPGVPGTTASTITGTGSLSTVLGVAAANLRVNDRVLVAVAGGSNANGVYSVTRLGGGTNWLLTRAADSDTAAELPANSFVRVTDGVGAGFYQLTYVSSTATPFARCPIGVSGALSLVTNIGSDDVNDAVTFVVSTAGVTNTAAGSLGKMIELRQANDTSSSASNPNQTMDFRFSGQVLTPIRLTQQLPRITEPFRIDGNTSYNPPGSPGGSRPRITIDGSRIVTNRDGNAVTATSVVNGFEISGTGAAGAVLANMTVAGFTRGAAVQVQDASTVLANGLTLGTNEFGLRVANQFGLRVSGNSSEVTLLNSTVTAATSAGVRIENAARDVVLVGNTIGTVDRDNAVGVQVAVSAGNRNRIGVDAVEPIAAIPPLVATRVNATTFTLPGSMRTSAATLIPGLGITGPGIAPNAGQAAAVIQSVSTNATTGVTTVVLTGGQVTAGGRVTFGHFAATTLGSQMLTMPVGVSADQLYLGQRIAGTGIVAGTRITAIDRATKVVTLSAAMTATGVTSITFPGVNNGAPRNVIQSNLVGVELAGGATTITNTSIINSARDGVRITGGTNVVGRTDRTRSAFSNMIYGNGGFGIAFDVGAGSRAAAVTLASQQTVRGNYLGMLMTNRAAAANTKGNIGLRFTTAAEELYRGAADMFLPRSPTGLDAEGNQHSPGTSGTGGTGSGGGGGGIPPVRPTR
jgi:subtilisin-like proprotein convertase family protein